MRRPNMIKKDAKWHQSQRQTSENQSREQQDKKGITATSTYFNKEMTRDHYWRQGRKQIEPFEMERSTKSLKIFFGKIQINK